MAQAPTSTQTHSTTQPKTGGLSEIARTLRAIEDLPAQLDEIAAQDPKRITDDAQDHAPPGSAGRQGEPLPVTADEGQDKTITQMPAPELVNALLSALNERQVRYVTVCALFPCAGKRYAATCAGYAANTGKCQGDRIDANVHVRQIRALARTLTAAGGGAGPRSGRMTRDDLIRFFTRVVYDVRAPIRSRIDCANSLKQLEGWDMPKPTTRPDASTAKTLQQILIQVGAQAKETPGVDAVPPRAELSGVAVEGTEPPPPAVAAQGVMAENPR